MADCLTNMRSLQGTMIFTSTWLQAGNDPSRLFGQIQFVEMPFYNQPVFDLPTELEFLLHTMRPRAAAAGTGRPLLKQHELMRVHPNDNERTLRSRLWGPEPVCVQPHGGVVWSSR